MGEQSARFSCPGGFREGPHTLVGEAGVQRHHHKGGGGGEAPAPREGRRATGDRGRDRSERRKLSEWRREPSCQRDLECPAPNVGSGGSGTSGRAGRTGSAVLCPRPPTNGSGRRALPGISGHSRASPSVPGKLRPAPDSQRGISRARRRPVTCAAPPASGGGKARGSRAPPQAPQPEGPRVPTHPKDMAALAGAAEERSARVAALGARLLQGRRDRDGVGRGRGRAAPPPRLSLPGGGGWGWEGRGPEWQKYIKVRFSKKEKKLLVSP